MSKWTKEQCEVISHRKGNLLVSAAAGSGKTAVLVEHVIDRLLDKEHPISLSSVVLEGKDQGTLKGSLFRE